MKLPPVQRFQKQNYPESPEWFSRFLQELNSFTETMWNILNKNITFADNLDAQVYSTSLLAGATASANTVNFVSTLKHVPQALIVGQVTDSAAYATPPTSAVWASWAFSNPQIQVNSISGLTSGRTYQLTFVVF